MTGATESAPLLTLAIPTYNRSACLDLCLSQAVPQVERFRGKVELIVSDNCSPGDSESVVRRYLDAGAPIRYFRNVENVGADRNFVLCWERAAGKYFMLLGDDDVLLDDGLEKILAVLEGGEYGVVHVKSHSFRENWRAERPKQRKPPGTIVYDDRYAFARKVNIMFTFISGNVVNRSMTGEGFDPNPFVGSTLVQLSWTLAALLNAPRNAFLDDFAVAAMADNTGGYRLCQVFGPSMNGVFDAFVAKGADPKLFRIVNRVAVSSFFPHYLLPLREGRTAFGDEDYYKTLHPVFKGYLAFWTMVVPAIRFPVPLARPWLYLCRKWMKAKKGLGLG